MTVFKAILQLVAAVLAAVLPGLVEDAPMNASAWVNVVILGAGAVMVYNAANLPGWNYAKLVASGVTAVGVVLVSALTDGGISGAEVIQMVIAGLGAVSVGVFPNARTVRSLP
jgi:intracellular sulfur oxidation DsrE/DsrF family protein